MEPLLALTLSTIIYAVILTLTYLFFIHKSPPGYKKPRPVEIAALVVLTILFFGIGYLFINLFE